MTPGPANRNGLRVTGRSVRGSDFGLFLSEVFDELALQSLTRYFEVTTGSELMPGVIAAIQTFGDHINFHPHLHL